MSALDDMMRQRMRYMTGYPLRFPPDEIRYLVDRAISAAIVERRTGSDIDAAVSRGAYADLMEKLADVIGGPDETTDSPVVE